MSDTIQKHEHIHIGREDQPDLPKKSFLEKLPFRKEKEIKSEKEKAEKNYIKKVDTDHPEQSPYVIKSSIQTPAVVAPQKSQSLVATEKLLSENLEDFFVSLDPAKQEEFRLKGEETATKIDEMVTTFRAKARQVISLIKQWLLLIPGINKFFLEQEAKIKTQKIMAYARQYKKDNKNKW